MFAVRDPAYLERMEKELKSENGFVNLIYEDDWFIGMESEWGLKERELRYLYTGERYRTGGYKAGHHGPDRMYAGICKKYPPFRGMSGG